MILSGFRTNNTIHRILFMCCTGIFDFVGGGAHMGILCSACYVADLFAPTWALGNRIGQFTAPVKVSQ